MTGPYVLLRAEGWSARWWPDGYAIDGVNYGVDIVRTCERLADGEAVVLPNGVAAHVGRSWLG